MRPNFDCRRTTGDIPAKLIGATITVIGSKAYIFGGRTAADNQALSDLFICDLHDFKWERLPFANVEITPSARFFHSADSWDDKLVIYGGYGLATASGEENTLLNDVQIFDTASRRWLPALILNRRLADSTSLPRPRHSHLSAVCADRLLIIGGEDSYRKPLDDICIYDLKRKTWVQRLSHPGRCSTYAGVATCGDLVVRIPSTEHSSVYRTERFSSPPTSSDSAPSSAPLHLPYSSEPTEKFPCKLYLYTNESNQHTDTERSLQVLSPNSSAFSPIDPHAINGYPAPPFLRNLTGSIIGTYLIVAGTFFGRTAYYAIWALNLQTMKWTHIDTGSNGVTGSWSRGCLWRGANKFLVFGDRNGTIAQDHSQRIMNWKDVTVVDLEVFGIYQPPPLALDLMTQELCLVALEEAVQTDFQIVCDNGRRIKCSRKILEARWPWFRNQLAKLLQQVRSAVEISVLPELQRGQGPMMPENRPDYRVDTRSFDLGEPYPVALALLQYIYTLSLLTPLQQEPQILSRLLELSTTLDTPHLQDLAKHAMHLTLSEKNCGIYESAVRRRPGCEGLQRRALKLLLQQSKKHNSNDTSFIDFRDTSQPSPPQLALDTADFFTRPRNQSFTGQRPVPNRISPIAEDSPPLETPSVKDGDEDDDESGYTSASTTSPDIRSDAVRSPTPSEAEPPPPRDPSNHSAGSNQSERPGRFTVLRSVFSPEPSKAKSFFGGESRTSLSSTRTNVPIQAGGGRRAFAVPSPVTKQKGKEKEKEKKEGGGGRRSSNVKSPLVKSSTVEYGGGGGGSHPAYANGNGNGNGRNGAGRHYDGAAGLGRNGSPRQFEHADGSDTSSGSMAYTSAYSSTAEMSLPSSDKQAPSQRALERTNSTRGSSGARSMHSQSHHG